MGLSKVRQFAKPIMLSSYPSQRIKAGRRGETRTQLVSREVFPKNKA